MASNSAIGIDSEKTTFQLAAITQDYAMPALEGKTSTGDWPTRITSSSAPLSLTLEYAA